jgi:peroxiredoxin
MKNVSKTLSLVLVSGLAASIALAASAQDTKKDHDTKVKHEDKAPAAKSTEKATEKSADKATAKAEIGKTAPNFTLKTTDGKDWSLSDAAGKIVVLEWCNPGCPVCQRVTSDGTVAEALKGAKEASSDVVYVMINSSASQPASLEKTGAYLKDAKLAIPALLDSDGKVGKMYGAKTTPHCYVIDSKGVLRYQGAIDDGDGAKKGKMNYVVNAVKQIKGNETVSPAETKPYGCGVKY